MFERLQDIYLNQALTLEQLEEHVDIYNNHVPKKNKIKFADLSQGEFVSLKKYLAKGRKLQKLQTTLQQRERKCMEMRMRILLLEQRLKAYEYMLVDIQEQRDADSI